MIHTKVAELVIDVDRVVAGSSAAAPMAAIMTWVMA